MSPDVSHHLAIYAIAALLLIEEAGVPLPMFPADGLLLAAGVLISTGLQPAATFPMLYLADVVGAGIGFSVASRIGRPGLRLLAARLGFEGALTRASAVLERWGTPGVALGRMVPGLRVYTNLVAGVAGVGRRAFAMGLLPSSALWIAIVTALGWALGESVQRYLARVGEVGFELSVLLTVVAGSYLALRLSAARAPRGSPSGRSRLALAGLVDVLLVAVFVFLLRALVGALGVIEPDGPFDWALIALAAAAAYLLLSGRSAGVTLGEAISESRYPWPWRRPSFAARTLGLLLHSSHTRR